VCLRRLLPQGLDTDVREPRVRRHLRELLLMDRAADAARLVWRWLRPPRAWHAFQKE
jgi:hypothetical protein